jgi:hypothetical protein
MMKTQDHQDRSGRRRRRRPGPGIRRAEKHVGDGPAGGARDSGDGQDQGEARRSPGISKAIRPVVGGARATGARPPATPEEQQQYDEIVAQALNLLSDAKNKPLRDKLACPAGGRQRSCHGARHGVLLRLRRGVQIGQAAGKTFDPGVMLAAGEEINQHVATFGKVRKVADYSQDEIDAAFLKAVDLFRQRNPDLLDPESAQADLHEIQDADQSGTLDKVAPGLAGALGKLKGLGQQAQSQAPQGAPAAPPEQPPQAAPQPGGA